MKIFFLGLLLNIATGLFNVPLGPERYIKRLYRSLYSVINIDLDSTTKKISDTMIYIAVIIVVFLIVWTMTEIYNIIPLPFVNELVCSALLCISLRIAQNDNLSAVYMLEHGNKDRAVKRLQKRGFTAGKDIRSYMLMSRSDTIRMIVCPIFFYMCFGIIAVLLYKTTEILSRAKGNHTAKTVHSVMEFIPGFLFKFIMRLFGSIIKRHIVSGDSVYNILCSYLGLGINSSKHNILSNDIVKSELLIYLSVAVCCLLSYAVSLLIGFIKVYFVFQNIP